jgi:hypothetical protein
MFERALARMQYEAALAGDRYAEPLRLQRFGRKVLSQNDEDGLIQEIFRRIGITSRRFVEIGVSNGLECNTAALVLDGWSGTWVEISSACVESGRACFQQAIGEGRLDIVCARATPATINQDLANWGTPEDFDLLSIDIDGNDYWLWQAIGQRPRVVSIEYNATWAPPLSITCNLDESRTWSQTSYFGASLSALEYLGREKGYTLVGCCYAGVNAFFVRDDLVREDLFAAPFTAANHFEPPRYDLGGILAGHPPGIGPVVTIAPPRLAPSAHEAMSQCRLCGAEASRLFERQVLGRYLVSYFRCKGCGSTFTEKPYWLSEAYSFPGVHIDIGMAHRAVRNWLALTRLLPTLGFASNDQGVDYGGGTGLLTRLFRDSGFNFLTHDRFRPSYFADMYEASELHIVKPRIITAFEVFEHFSNPIIELAEVLDAGADIIIFSTSFCDDQDIENWEYLVPECGQHVFFYSRRGFEDFCIARGYDYIHGTFLQALVRRGSHLEGREQEIAEEVSRWDLPDAHVAHQVQFVIRGNEHITRDALNSRRRFAEAMAARDSDASLIYPSVSRA